MKKLFLEAIFPDGVECVICDRLLFESHTHLCSTCKDQFQYITGNSCNGCGVSLPDHYDDIYCAACSGRQILYNHGLACVVYDDFSSRVIWKFKYQDKRYIGRMMGYEMADLLKATYIEDVNLIVPVPIFIGKAKKKGYNHSAVIAKEIGVLCGLKVIDDFLIRRRKTRPLKDLTKEERQKELKNVFDLNPCYKDLFSGNKRILLVDDIYTTGTTIKECCQILRGYGYNIIIVMTFATGQL